MAPPFPYSGPRYPLMDTLRELSNAWRASCPRVPSGWSSDWSADPAPDPDDDFHGVPMFHTLSFIPYLGRFPYEMEHTFNYFGTPTPIIYQDEGMNVRMFFSAGGLMFLLVEEPLDSFMVVPPDWTVDEAAALLKVDWGESPFPAVSKYLQACCMQQNALLKWVAEREISGRNR
ncbi:uncharacterized protein PHACADRAFT_249732 [Phanerochaete carnosa HHB-10118-sp]|uniref:Uncharacterized protein n=1 Tax=Phanerochaete carnosa (strain HHB-10118-sp) TaxID=650164 RepID=K5X8Z2_PHACS|nr:uncharacterized protein PHACADRAFT_249732 [Phanerochaete carnosa HHB-10118-sp]EKM59317.1 hypothetical protein PHACADRAFT_249732 [Phanerochaete carnosa HHB-10118-sp]